MAVLEEVTQAVRSVTDRTGPSVVGLGRRGSGVVIGENSVLTTAHILRREETTVTFADGRRESASVAGVDADGDLAVLTVDTGDVPAVEWGEPDSLAAGSVVFALASPGGRG